MRVETVGGNLGAPSKFAGLSLKQTVVFRV